MCTVVGKCVGGRKKIRVGGGKMTRLWANGPPEHVNACRVRMRSGMPHRAISPDGAAGNCRVNDRNFNATRGERVEPPARGRRRKVAGVAVTVVLERGGKCQKGKAIKQQ